MAEKRPERGKDRRFRPPMRTDEHRHGPLQCIEQQGQRRQRLAASPQDIGRADIAGTDRSDVFRSGDFRDDEAERDRTQEISGCKCGQIEFPDQAPADRIGHFSTYVSPASRS